MERHFMVTVSEQTSALYAVRFVSRFFSTKSEIRLTLYYTAPKPPELGKGEQTREDVIQREKQAEEQEAKGRAALEKANQELLGCGFGEDRIHLRFQVRRYSKVMDIVREAHDVVAIPDE